MSDYEALSRAFKILAQAIHRAGTTRCPQYIAHPQGVWYQEHIITPLQDAFDEAQAVLANAKPAPAGSNAGDEGDEG